MAKIPFEKQLSGQQNHGTPDRTTHVDPEMIEKFRRRRIDAFRNRQRIQREWICFADIAEWFARATGDIKPDEERRSLAYDELSKSLAAGEFEQAGRSQVLFLNPETSMAKMSTERWNWIDGFFDKSTLQSEYLASCWIRLDLCRGWFEAKRLAVPPWLTPIKTSNPLNSTGQQNHSNEQASRPKRANSENTAGLVSDRTGAQGRPTSSHLVIQEFRRRIERNAVLDPLNAEAQALSDWLAATHPGVAAMTRKTVENRIRDAHRNWKASK